METSNNEKIKIIEKLIKKGYITILEALILNDTPASDDEQLIDKKIEKN